MIKEKEISYAPTGDPFVDAGGMAFEYIAKQFPDKTVEELIRWAAHVNRDKRA